MNGAASNPRKIVEVLPIQKNAELCGFWKTLNGIDFAGLSLPHDVELLKFDCSGCNLRFAGHYHADTTIEHINGVGHRIEFPADHPGDQIEFALAECPPNWEFYTRRHSLQDIRLEQRSLGQSCDRAREFLMPLLERYQGESFPNS